LRTPAGQRNAGGTRVKGETRAEGAPIKKGGDDSRVLTTSKSNKAKGGHNGRKMEVFSSSLQKPKPLSLRKPPGPVAGQGTAGN